MALVFAPKAAAPGATTTPPAVVKLGHVQTNQALVSRARQLQDALAAQNYQKYCEERANEGGPAA